MLKMCPKCGEESSFYNFCPKCGTEMIPAPRCKYCGEDLRKYMDFCPGCGHSREEAINTRPTRPPSFWETIKSLFSKKTKKENA